MGLFRAGHGWGNKKVPAPKNPSHIPYNAEILHSYTLPEVDLKII